MCVYTHTYIHTYIHTYTDILTYIYNYYYHAQMPASPAVPRNATCIHNTLQTRARNPMLSIGAVTRLGCWGLGVVLIYEWRRQRSPAGGSFPGPVSPPCRVPKMARGLEAGKASRGGPGGHYKTTHPAGGRGLDPGGSLLFDLLFPPQTPTSRTPRTLPMNAKETCPQPPIAMNN